MTSNGRKGAAFGTKYHKDVERWILKGVVPDPSKGVTKEEREELQLRQDLLIAAIDSGEIPDPFDETALVEYDVVMDDITGRLDLFWACKLRDHKTTVNAKLWAPTAEDLIQDIQANFYGLACMIEMDLESLDCVWLYMCRTTRTCTPVYFTLIRSEAQALWDSTLKTREKMTQLVDNPPDDPLQIAGANNPAACAMYGGCKFKDECSMSDPMDKFMKKKKIAVNPGPAREDSPPPVADVEKPKPAAKKKAAAKRKPAAKKKPAAKPELDVYTSHPEGPVTDAVVAKCAEKVALDSETQVVGKGAFLVVPLNGGISIELLSQLVGK